jgi:L-amino acid N-acyltransferase YncA
MIGAALVTRRAGETTGGQPVPLLNWIFVLPIMKRHGMGELLLKEVVSALRRMNCSRLESVACTGNHSSMAWHWAMGFEMGPTMGERIARRQTAKGGVQRGVANKKAQAAWAT